ncbi:hypothetical protein A3Q56_00989 [Intoshia linei]|uniref:ubiquitinyl hydrolase 1 n=1 Tax=Intoshia linei TaxID=1819745 RepID=A0A177BCK2_9BILA|nr:hypothetical protein A3Q56_00989 [Intoshia linei]
MEKELNLYHEKQFLQFCAKHTLNNLYQQHLFTWTKLNYIAHKLTPNFIFNPHRSIFLIGNYDVNVIMKAVEVIKSRNKTTKTDTDSNVKKYKIFYGQNAYERDFNIKWHDSRKEFNEELAHESFGFILNLSSGGIFGTFKKNHWIAMRKMSDGYFYNLNSELERPKRFDAIEDFLDFVNTEIKDHGAQLLIVMKCF